VRWLTTANSAHPTQAGKKIWRREPSISAFDASNNCKGSGY
jgi:hypothetical protein